MSHELRSPLNSIRSLSGFLLDRGDGDLTGEQEKQVRLIRKASEDLMGLVNDLLDLARVEAGKALIRPRWFEIAPLFEGLQGTIRPIVEGSSVSLVFEDPIEPTAPVHRRGKAHPGLAQLPVELRQVHRAWRDPGRRRSSGPRIG